jgi:hypothetical protein
MYKRCTVSSIFSTHIALALSPQPFTSHYFTTYINFSLLVVYIIFLIPLSVPRKHQEGAWNGFHYDTNQRGSLNSHKSNKE